MDNELRLPNPAAYKAHCVHASHSWLVYQTSASELKLLEYTVDFVLKENLSIYIST